MESHGEDSAPRSESSDFGVDAERLRHALAGTSDGLWDWNVLTDEVFYSTRWEEMFGFAPGEAEPILGTFADLVHPDDAPGMYAEVDRYLQKEIPSYSYEFRMHRLDGTLLWTQHRATAIFDQEGRPVRMIGTTMDTTARRLAEADLQRTKEMLEATNRMARVGGWELDLRTQELYWSEVTKEIHEVQTDFVPDLEAGIGFYEEGESRDTIAEVVRRAIDDGEPYDVELRIVTAQGRKVWVRAMGRAEFEDDACVRLRGTFQDIDQRKRYETELARARELADMASEAKSAFLANMSHEIRTPMNAILGLAELVRGTELTPQQEDYLAKLHSSSKSLLTILDDILDLSRIEADQLILTPRAFRVAELAHRVEGLFGELARQQGLGLDFTVADSVPDRVHGDSGRITQVLNNLVGNAIKFTKKGSIAVHVDLARIDDSGDDEAVRLLFSVRDTGIGIPPSQIDLLFEPFVQADISRSRRFGGTGLGLSICKRLVELMGGVISVESETGRGSNFTFTIACQPAEDSASTGPSSEEDTESVRIAPWADDARILLVEDNELNRLVARAFFENVGIEIDTARDGYEAIDKTRDRAYDLVLMDLQMPGMDGYEATRRIHAHPGSENLPIIAVTASAMEEDRRACAAAGMIDFLHKPLDSTRLIEVSKQHIEAYRANRGGRP